MDSSLQTDLTGSPRETFMPMMHEEIQQLQDKVAALEEQNASLVSLVHCHAAYHLCDMTCNLAPHQNFQFRFTPKETVARLVELNIRILAYDEAEEVLRVFGNAEDCAQQCSDAKWKSYPILTSTDYHTKCKEQ